MALRIFTISLFLQSIVLKSANLSLGFLPLWLCTSPYSKIKGNLQHLLWKEKTCTHSGVTRVGDTRGGNWGCHSSIFSCKTWRPFFAHRCHYHYRFLLLSLECHPFQGVTPHLFYLPDVVSPLFFVNLPIKFFSFGCHPPGGCHPGQSAPCPLVTPLCTYNNYIVANTTFLTTLWRSDRHFRWPVHRSTLMK